MEKKLIYKVISDKPVTNEEYVLLFKESEIREIFVRYLSDKKIASVMERGQAPTEEAEFRRWGIAMIDSIIADMHQLEEWIKNKINTRIRKNKQKAEDTK